MARGQRAGAGGSPGQGLIWGFLGRSEAGEGKQPRTGWCDELWWALGYRPLGAWYLAPKGFRAGEILAYLVRVLQGAFGDIKLGTRWLAYERHAPGQAVIVFRNWLASPGQGRLPGPVSPHPHQCQNIKNTDSITGSVMHRCPTDNTEPKKRKNNVCTETRHWPGQLTRHLR